MDPIHTRSSCNASGRRRERPRTPGRRDAASALPIALAIAASTLCRSHLATAAPGDPHWELTPVVGRTFFGERPGASVGSRLRDSFYAGGLAGVGINRWLGVDLAAGFMPTGPRLSAVDQADYAHVAGEIELKPLRAGPIEGFVTGGLGYGRLAADVGPRDTHALLETSAGLKLWAANPYAVRLEVRDLMRLKTLSDVALGNARTIVVSAGLTLAPLAEAPSRPTEIAPAPATLAPAAPPVALADTSRPVGGTVSGSTERPSSLAIQGATNAASPPSVPREAAPPSSATAESTPRDTAATAAASSRALEAHFDGELRLEVHFDTDRAELDPGAKAILDSDGAALVHERGLELEIAGHADSRGTAEHNRALSVRRARNVERYLARRFPALDRHMRARGYGEARPLVANTSEENLARNRRVEIVVLGDEPGRGGDAPRRMPRGE